MRDGLKVIVFEQSSEALEKRFGFRVVEYGLRQVFRRIPDSPLLLGLDEETLRDWRGEATVLPPRLKYEMRPGHGPTVSWCGIPVTRAWRCGCRGNVASVLIEKPARGDFLPVIDGGFSLQFSPLMEYREGRGMVLFCQMDVTGRTEDDPAADLLFRNILNHVSGWKPSAVRKALYAGDPAGKAHLESAGFSLSPYAGGPLVPDQVLVAAPGCASQLAAHSAHIASWLKEGGNLLAAGLDGNEANAFLPFKIGTSEKEHISAVFDPPGAGSLMAGVCPADVHNRAPRNMPLVSSGAGAIGDGVLAKAGGLNAVFCQPVPWRFDYQKNYGLKRTFRRSSFLLNRLLANMGASGATPLLERFSSPADPSGKDKRWLAGLYLDEPEEWDDPYRFFRW